MQQEVEEEKERKKKKKNVTSIGIGIGVGTRNRIVAAAAVAVAGGGVAAIRSRRLGRTILAALALGLLRGAAPATRLSNGNLRAGRVVVPTKAAQELREATRDER